MDPSSAYAIAAGGLFLLVLLYRLTTRILSFIRSRTVFFLLKHFIYPYVFHRHRFTEPVTREQFILQVIYWCATAACNFIRVNTMAQASARAGTLSVINLIPLLFAGRLSYAADLFGVSLGRFYALHRSIGFMVVVQGLVHISILLKKKMVSVHAPDQIYGILGASSLGLVCLLPLIRGPFYELFSCLHYALALLTAFALWRHLTIRKAFAHTYVLIAAAILLSTTLLRWISIIFRNFVYGKSLARSYISGTGNALEVHLTIPRPWKVQAGQYIYLWMPGVSGSSVFQLHPFMITWWYNNSYGNADQIALLIEPKSGFTAKLEHHLDSGPLLAWIDGPYGQPRDIGNYGSVVMFATGMGIAAHMPYLKELMNGYRECNVRTRRISLIWQLDRESNQDWVQKWMEELLEADKGSYIFQTSLYVLRDFEIAAEYGDRVKYGEHDRVRKFYGKVDLLGLMKNEMDKRKGEMLVTVSADDTMRDQVRDLVQRNIDFGVKLMELDYQPVESRSIWSLKRDEIQHSGVV